MKTLSVVIPVYNEQDRLKKTFEALKELRIPRGLKLEKVIFVNDGSTDKTVSSIRYQVLSIEKKLNAKVKVELISYKENKGKGYAVRQGMLASNSDYTLFCDADMSTPFSELKKLLPFIKKGSEVVVGTRKNGGSTVVKHQPLYREILGRCFTLLSNLVLNTYLTDFTCGFKVFSRKAKDSLFPLLMINRWGFDAEILFLAQKYGFKTKEVSVVWSDDRASKVNLLRDIPVSLFELVQIRALYFLGRYEDENLPQVSPKPAFSNLFRTIRTFLF